MKTKGLSQGFTLVEVVIVIALIGILAAIAIPSFRGLMPRIRLGNATQTLSNTIAMARMAAIAKSTTYAVQIDKDGNSIDLFQFTDDPSTAAVDYDWRKNATTSLGASVAIASVKYQDGTTVLPPAPAPPAPLRSTLPTLQLNANGSTNVPFARLALRIVLETADGTLKKRVVVASSGRIFSQQWTGGNVNDDAAWVEE